MDALFTAMTTWLKELIDSMTAFVTGNVPVVLVLVGLSIGVAFGVRWLRKFGKAG